MVTAARRIWRQRKEIAITKIIADKYWLAQLKRWPLSRVYGKRTGVVVRSRRSKLETKAI